MGVVSHQDCLSADAGDQLQVIRKVSGNNPDWFPARRFNRRP
jgi:hypothetical protein